VNVQGENAKVSKLPRKKGSHAYPVGDVPPGDPIGGSGGKRKGWKSLATNIQEEAVAIHVPATRGGEERPAEG